MTFGEYLLGLALLCVTAGSCWAAAALVVARRLPQAPRHARGAARGVLFAAAVLAATLVPAALGLLGRASGAAGAVLVLALTRALVRGPGGPAVVPAAEPPAREPLLSRLLGAGGVVLVAGWCLAAGWLASAVPSAGRDALTFHLPVSVRWLQAGSIWHPQRFEPLLATGYYPQNGDALNLALIAPFHSDAFVRVLTVLSLAAFALAVFALARELGAPPAAASLGAALVGALPISVLTAEEGAMTDMWCLAALAAGGMFLLRHLRSGARDDLLLGSLALGLALGTKWYGLSAAALVVAAWAAARLWQRPRARAALRELATVVALCALGGGIWLVRNWVETGNPLFPARVRVAGLTVFDAPADPVRACAGFRVADYAGDGHVLRHVLWPLWRGALGAGAAILLVSLVAAPVLARRSRRTTAVALLGLALVLMYTLLPDSALGPRGFPVFAAPNTRYLMPALAVGAALLAYALPRLGRIRHLAELLIVIVAARGLREGLFLSDGRIVAGVVGAVLLGALVLAARRAPRVLVRAGVGVAVLTLALTGYARQRDFYEARYRGADAALDVLRSTPSGTRVALAGFESTGIVPHVLPAFGRRFGNRVTYVGEDNRGMLQPYVRRERFVAALARGRFDYLLVARGHYLVPCRLPGDRADPGGWARAAGWRLLTQSAPLALYRRP